MAIEEGRRKIKNSKDFESVRDEGEDLMRLLRREDDNFARMRELGEGVTIKDRGLMMETCRNILCWYHRLTVNASLSISKLRQEGHLRVFEVARTGVSMMSFTFYSVY